MEMQTTQWLAGNQIPANKNNKSRKSSNRPVTLHEQLLSK